MDSGSTIKNPLYPVSLRLTFEEKANLELAAAGMSLSSYIRWRIFDPASPPPKHRRKQPVKDHVALARLLAMMGQSRIGNNLNQLAKAVNSGSLPVTPETEAELLEAARAIVHMRRLLLEALQIEATP
jgi:Bacterial mobilisation protein (MobC)